MNSKVYLLHKATSSNRREGVLPTTPKYIEANMESQTNEETEEIDVICLRSHGFDKSKNKDK